MTCYLMRPFPYNSERCAPLKPTRQHRSVGTPARREGPADTVFSAASSFRGCKHFPRVSGGKCSVTVFLLFTKAVSTEGLDPLTQPQLWVPQLRFPEVAEAEPTDRAKQDIQVIPRTSQVSYQITRRR